MSSTNIRHRAVALGLLIGALVAGAGCLWSACATFADGQRDVVAKTAQLRSLRELAEARLAFSHLSTKGKPAAVVLPPDADAEAVLTNAVTQAAARQEVIVDGIETLPGDPVSRLAAVHLRGTQAGLYAFLRAIEAQTPYVLVPRLEMAPSRAADLDHGKPLVLSADLRLAVLVTPAPPPKPQASSEPSP